MAQEDTAAYSPEAKGESAKEAKEAKEANEGKRQKRQIGTRR